MGSHSSRRPTPSPRSNHDLTQRRYAARRAAREAAGLSLEQLAEKLGRPPAAIERMERSGTVPQHLAGEWSKVLGCKIELFS